MIPSIYIETVLPKMEGWCTPAKAERLVDLTGKEAVKTFVEIGVFGGRSLFSVALTQCCSLMPPMVSIGIDPWCVADSVKGFSDANADWWKSLDHDKIYAECRRLQSALGLDDICHLLRCNSSQALSLVSRIGPIDMLHIDGNHSEESSCFDVDRYSPLVKSGGIIAFDDMSWSTTKRAQTAIMRVCDQIDQVGDCCFFRKK